VSRHHVPLDHAVRRANGLDPDMDVASEGAAKDTDVAAEEDAEAVALGVGRAVTRATSPQDPDGARQREAPEVGSRGGDAEQTRTTSVEGDDAGLEITHGAVFHGHPTLAFGGDPNVTERDVRVASGCGCPISVNRVAVQVERDVVRLDEDADIG